MRTGFKKLFCGLQLKTPWNLLLLASLCFGLVFLLTVVCAAYDSATVVFTLGSLTLMPFTLVFYHMRVKTNPYESPGKYVLWGSFAVGVIQMISTIISYFCLPFPHGWVPFVVGHCVLFYSIFLMLDLIHQARNEEWWEDYNVGLCALSVLLEPFHLVNCLLLWIFG